MSRQGLSAGAAITRARTGATDGHNRAVRLLARAAALACLLTALLAGPAFAQPKAKKLPITDAFYGVNAGGGVFGSDPEHSEAHLSAMQRTGIVLLRNDANWGSVEPAPPDPATGARTYHWEQFDARVAAMAAHGIRWYPIIDYSAPWASSIPGDQMAPPARDEDYVAYARAFAQRYGRDGAFWQEHPELPALPVQSYEIWNEPNFNVFWKPQDGAAARYASLYAASRAALKAVDSRAQVVVGGLVDWSGPRFVREMYRARPDLRGRVDALGYHEYHHDLGDVRRSLKLIRATLKHVGDGKVPIEVTEAGWSTAMESEPQRAQSLASLVRDIPRWDFGVTRVIAFSWYPGEAEGFGIANEDATLKPSGAAYVQAIDAMTGPADVKRTAVRGNPGRPLVRPNLRR